MVNHVRGIASACGSATVINAIAAGRGSAFAIDMRVKASVELFEDPLEIRGEVDGSEEDSELIETAVRRVLEEEGSRDLYGAKVETKTNLPIAVGLSSSSAAANATVLGTYAAIGKEPDPQEAIGIGIDAAFEAGTTVTGAFDDASASYFGGGTMTDNENREILKRFELDPSVKVLIYVPPDKSYTKEVDVGKVGMIRDLMDLVEEKAMKGNIYGAQTLNGLIYSSVLNYDFQPALKALEAGAEASGLTGTGPAVVAISK